MVGRGVLGPFLNTLTQCLCSVPVLPYSRDVLHHTADQGGGERERRREMKEWETERQRERETVRLLVGRGETPAEEGGHGLPGATYTHLDLSPHPEDAFV